jgi:3-isopropylmalate/(R)-2-methylmalate dehydratase small subunit
VEPFIVHTGRAVPLRRSNVDTDQIIPSDYLKRITRTGFEDGLFREWRSDPNFVLDRPEYVGASILLAGPDFGTGSSREHAVWALQDGGFKAVVSSRFADIFRGNALKGGLLPVMLSADSVESLMAAVESDPTVEVTVDLQEREVRCGAKTFSFDLEDSGRYRLLNGLDDIALTLQQVDDIDRFESGRPAYLPTTLPVRAG